MSVFPTPDDLSATVKRALNEDVGTGDLTASLIDLKAHATAQVVAREQAVLAGQPWFDTVFSLLNTAIKIHWFAGDGESVGADEAVCELSGPARPMLTGERTAVNFLQMLSAVATRTRRYNDAVLGTGCHILDTRKTLPGLRSAQKYAVRAGGGTNHRMGLFDAVLIKENHIIAAGSIDNAVGAVRACHANTPVTVEVEDFEQLDAAIAAGADRILIDNFSLEQKREAVKRTSGRAILEASGNIELDGLRAIAETGVDYISVGALTKNIRAIDFSMRLTIGNSQSNQRH